MAAEAGGAKDARRVRIAQAASFQVMCTAWVERDKIVQIVKEGNQCFKENVSPFGGKVRGREPVQCSAKCPEVDLPAVGISEQPVQRLSAARGFYP